jgi:hypothetical protein
MPSDSRKIAFVLLGALSSITAAASVILFKSLEMKVSENRPEFVAILIGLVSVAMAAVSAVYMQQFLRRQELRHAARRVFIIYAKEDLDKARQIAELLKERGLEPWLDVDQIEAGQIWKSTLDEALDNSAMAVVLSSENFSKSSLAMDELNRALGKMESKDRMTSPIIPIKIDKSEIPKSISHIQYVDMADKNASDFLIRSIEGAMRRIVGSTTGVQIKQGRSP